MRKNSRIIFACDVQSREKAISLAEEIGDLVDAIKVGYPLTLATGLSIVGDLAAYGPVICDFKVADIDNTNRLIVQEVMKAGASGVICHGFVGKDALMACIDAAEGREVFVVAEMSHPGAEKYIKPVSEDIARLAVEIGASGIIAPGTRQERITALREIVGDLLILTPGIGAQGGGAKGALDAGADYIIVGRSIYNSDNPRAEVEKILSEINR